MALTVAVSTIKILGNIGTFALPIFVGLRAFLKRQTIEGISFGTAAGIQKLVIKALKGQFLKPRPFPNAWQLDSFPSGHTAFSFLGVGYTLAASLLDPNESSIAYKVTIITFALLISASRYLSNMHHLTDIIAGGGIGLFFGAASALVPYFLNKSSITPKTND